MEIHKPRTEIQRYIDDLMQANKNYAQIASKYIGVDDTVWEKYKADSNSIAVVTGWLIYLANNMEKA